MRTVTFFWILFVIGIFCIRGQETSINFRTKRVLVQDTIHIDTVSINSYGFKIISKNNTPIDTTAYRVNYARALLIVSPEIKSQQDSISIQYYRYPEFLTKKYFEFDASLIVQDQGGLQKLYRLSTPRNQKKFVPFDGLTTNGSLSRGVSIGNSQNSVLNSELDLQISGKISEHVSLRASIQDANVPIQSSGYSQNLDAFDQVFIELSGRQWNVRAGDVQLQNTDDYFNRFTKNVQGISLKATLPHTDAKTDVFAAAALVRGVFTRSQFAGQEGNQGPYKLTGPNGELFILIVSGSERVFVNGIQLERGENKDYLIDYNAGEVKFNATYPITSDMRIAIEYQITERNFSRIIAYGGAMHSEEKFSIGASIYSENDAKNQSLQQNLTDQQRQILADAGDDQLLMTAPSAIPDTFDENKILYRKEIVNGEEIFAFSTDPTEELFNVRFTEVGMNQGDYRLASVNTINRIYEYISPLNGIPQGRFAPVISLKAPTKIQAIVVKGSYVPTNKTGLNFELAGSNNDLNLFSTIDDKNNKGIASRVRLEQRILERDSSWSLNFVGSGDFIQKDFKSVERIYNVEFTRDWNLDNPLGDQKFVSTGMLVSHPHKGMIRYNFQNLNFSENYNGNRHFVTSDLQLKHTQIGIQSSLLDSKNESLDSRFFRLYARIAQGFSKYWVGTTIAIEDNKELNRIDQNFTTNTQRFNSYQVYTGVGDSTKVFAEIGYRYRVNDSVRNNQLSTVSTSNTYYLKSNLITSEQTQLGLYINYRFLNNTDILQDDEESLTSRLLYNQRFFKNKIIWNTLFETNSGTLPQQEFTYVEVDPGQGTYTWNDYNDNGIQELEEFEIAPFTDQATYLKVLLPNQLFLKTHQNRLSQILTLNPSSWIASKSITQRFLSRFYNQTSYILDKKILREGNSFTINPFNKTENELALNLSIRNTIFFNRGKQRYTTTYSYVSSRNTNLQVTGLQENKIQNHQMTFTHKLINIWLFDYKQEWLQTQSISENFTNRNYFLEGLNVEPKVSYLLSDQTQFSVFYQYNAQKNNQGTEQLFQQRLGVSFAYANKQQISMTGEFNFVNNDFLGNAFSPVGYQLLNGLQPGDNYTWSLIGQKKLTKYLDLNLSYQGRKSNTSRTIHTGSMQLRAYF